MSEQENASGAQVPCISLLELNSHLTNALRKTHDAKCASGDKDDILDDILESIISATECAWKVHLALARRDRALRRIKEMHSRWYDQGGDAADTVRDMESAAVCVWMEEDQISNNMLTVSGERQKGPTT